jgi:hypothetical protein
MVKRALSAVVGFLGLCLPSFAQQPGSPDFFRALNDPFRFPSLALSDGQPFSFSEAVAPMLSFDWVETVPSVDLPALTVTGPRRVAYVSGTVGKDSSKEVVDVRPPKFTYADGEVGAFYGRSSGKFGREIEAGYLWGEVGDDKFNITAGASYEHSSGKVPRWGR